MLIAISTNESFSLASVDVTAAFLQSRALDKDVYMLPLLDIRKSGIIWKLKKPLYGLDDASRKFWLRAKEALKKVGFKVMEGDEAFYYRDRNGKLIGAVITHVDDFTLAGTKEFIKEVLDALE